MAKNQIKCPKCNIYVQKGKFCPECGMKLINTDTGLKNNDLKDLLVDDDMDFEDEEIEDINDADIMGDEIDEEEIDFDVKIPAKASKKDIFASDDESDEDEDDDDEDDDEDDDDEYGDEEDDEDEDYDDEDDEEVTPDPEYDLDDDDDEDDDEEEEIKPTVRATKAPLPSQKKPKKVIQEIDFGYAEEEEEDDDEEEEPLGEIDYGYDESDEDEDDDDEEVVYVPVAPAKKEKPQPKKEPVKAEKPKKAAPIKEKPPVKESSPKKPVKEYDANHDHYYDDVLPELLDEINKFPIEVILKVGIGVVMLVTVILYCVYYVNV